ncbi:hypothetical protein RvY_11029-1 [Ramazzottius varieornatus]|uniref:Uncharacterized protein n=1 Tax=Ramazzottius varieornatus TaxID=947166 RepID=A0A1D1VK69_RAMVA|nr:hypothetical protein RvY_11029-1 [Ramazzottius varieornatus]
MLRCALEYKLINCAEKFPFLSFAPPDSAMESVNPLNILNLLLSDYEQHLQLSDSPSESDKMLKTLIEGTSTVNFYSYVDFPKHISGLVLCLQTSWTSRSAKLEVRYRPLKIFDMSSRLACRRSISWKSLSLNQTVPWT